MCDNTTAILVVMFPKIVQDTTDITITDTFRNNGFKLEDGRYLTPGKDGCKEGTLWAMGEKHYAEYKDAPAFLGLLENMSKGTILVQIFSKVGDPSAIEEEARKTYETLRENLQLEEGASSALYCAYTQKDAKEKFNVWFPEPKRAAHCKHLFE